MNCLLSCLVLAPAAPPPVVAAHDRIAETAVVMTVVGGRIVYKKKD